MRTETGNSDEEDANDPERPQSPEPWRLAAEAWTHHAEAWAQQTDQAARAASAPSTASTAGTADGRWARPSVEPVTPATGGGWGTAEIVDDLGEIPEPPPLSPWPELTPDERTAHPHAWSPRSPARRYLAPVAGAAAFVLCLAGASWAVWGWSRGETQPPLTAPPAPPRVVATPASPSAEPPTLLPSPSAQALVPQERPEEHSPRPADALAHWANALRQIDIPPVALQAYGYAEAVLTTAEPSCKLSWTLLAGIGAVESNHGRYGGAGLAPDGTSTKPIIGVPLAGIGVERVRDTDGGTLDGDRQWDRAIGPMQFLPSTWKAWSVDADHNGRADPYDIDDAALAAGYYLCAGGQNLSTADGWSSAVYSYNRVPAYVERVYEYADAYGRAT
ncbi:lytic transglycosylase domain-containing protein [Cryptosporangium sp. NPDC051539]|uniref:lytic transglycosylase domain-containing protein n=1 Tax=Cryptosporangium sp. NPDC051539 TaxID=3363962 RepID=UPI00379C8D10